MLRETALGGDASTGRRSIGAGRELTKTPLGAGAGGWGGRGERFHVGGEIGQPGFILGRKNKQEMIFLSALI